MNKVELTGRTRCRVETRGMIFSRQVLILQVEERRTGHHEDIHGPGPRYDYCAWRDAKPEDMQIWEGNHGPQVRN